MEPTSKEIVDLGMAASLGACLDWAGVKGDLSAAWYALMGFEAEQPTAHPNMVAVFTEEEYAQCLTGLKIGSGDTQRSASMRERAAVRLVWKAAAAACRQPGQTLAPVSQDRLAEAVAALAASTAAAGKIGKKVKASNVIDPADESDVPAATSNQMAEWYDNYKAIKYGEPLPDKEPTPDQISAVNVRVVDLLLEPYADFSVLTPHGRRMQKILRHRSWLLQEDGSYKPVEVPGPGNFETWSACFRVYEVILLMLRFPPNKSSSKPSLVVTPIALDAYYENFAVLVKENPECWHLCQRAEDRCRAEHFPRLARRLKEKLGQEPTWSEVFVEAAEDDRYWDREVRRPALAFLARGSRPSAPLQQMEEQLEDVVRASGGDVKSRNQRKAETAKRRRLAADAPIVQPPTSGSGPAKGKKSENHPKQFKGLYVTTEGGQQICFAYAGKTCSDPCPGKRAHVCQICLGKHKNADCPKK